MSDPRRLITDTYLAAARKAITSADTPARPTPVDYAALVDKAATAAVNFDRERMANQLRNRVIHSKSAMGAERDELAASIMMKIEDMLFQLAEQIQHGLPFTAEDVR